MRLSVGMKLYGGFAIVLGLLFVVALIGAGRLRQSAITAEEALYEQSTLPMQYAMQTANAEMTASFNEKRALLKSAATNDRLTRIEQSRRSMQAAERWAEQYAAAALTPEERQTWDQVTSAAAQVHADRDRVLDLLARGEDEEAERLSAQVTSQVDVLAFQLDLAVEQQRRDAADAAAGVLVTARTARNAMIALAVAATALGGGLAFWLTRGIVGRVNRMKVAAEGIARGDLEQAVEVRSRDEIGEMAASFREMIASLGAAAATAEQIAAGNLTVRVEPRSERDTLGHALALMVTTLRTTMSETRIAAAAVAEAKDQLALVAEEAARATQEVARAATQVAEGTAQQAENVQEINQSVEGLALALQQVTSGAAQQATAIEETSAVSDRVAVAAQQMAAGATLAADGARSTADTAQEGAMRVSDTIAGIDRIKRALDAASHEVGELGARSAEIGDIVETIDDIAAQTNLLALNAAIEAARAGEQGRGFAVVADEVRRLAERVSAATKEIAGLIGGVQQGVTASVRAMDEGTQQMNAGTTAAADAGRALERILEAVSSVGAQIGQIADGAADLRTSGIEMAGRIQDIRSVADENVVAARAMTGTADAVGDAVGGIAAVAEQSSASMEQVSASAEEMSAQVEEIWASTNELGRMADRLNEQLDRFVLEERPAPALEAAATPGDPQPDDADTDTGTAPLPLDGGEPAGPTGAGGETGRRAA